VSRGEIVDGSVLAEMSKSEIFSATEIEAYLQCPYRWFCERVVRPEEIDVEVDARAVGTIAHSFLRAFYDALPAALSASRVTPENADAAGRLLGTVIAGTDTGIAAEGLAEELALARAARWVATAVADDAYVLPGFVPMQHELSFGAPGETAIRLGGVSFRGRIDRIDGSGDAVFVTDYKASRQVSGHAKFADEGKIQAVVYALVASEKAGLPIAGSVYRSLPSRQMRGFWRADLLHGGLALGHEDDSLGEHLLEEIVAGTAQRIETAVAGIRAGRVPREPSKSACQFCALRMQCEGAQR
jgi:ATP-dependent helicase/nuclease subunit B